jgi:hypothetical protein
MAQVAGVQWFELWAEWGWLNSRGAGQPTLFGANPRALRAFRTLERESDVTTPQYKSLTQFLDNLLRLREHKSQVLRPVPLELMVC